MDVRNVADYIVSMMKKLEYKHICHHHEFLDWEKKRFEDLEKRMKPKIPLCKLPPWESVPASVTTLENEPQYEPHLQRWILSRCKRESIVSLFFLFVVGTN